ncbi:hypothetical protein CSC33_0679 [Pseudomonas aeruginosa]|nr:hypothetical protein CSC33_0679 [Pseudomonas aeruginosa]
MGTSSQMNNAIHRRELAGKRGWIGQISFDVRHRRYSFNNPPYHRNHRIPCPSKLTAQGRSDES